MPHHWAEVYNKGIVFGLVPGTRYVECQSCGAVAIQPERDGPIKRFLLVGNRPRTLQCPGEQNFPGKEKYSLD